VSLRDVTPASTAPAGWSGPELPDCGRILARRILPAASGRAIHRSAERVSDPPHCNGPCFPAAVNHDLDATASVNVTDPGAVELWWHSNATNTALRVSCGNSFIALNERRMRCDAIGRLLTERELIFRTRLRRLKFGRTLEDTARVGG
jgi:hypothetical protein